MLEKLDEPLGVVTGIAGQTRMLVTVFGTQGHAGTVPMSIRADPTPAAAEAILAVERRCSVPGGARTGGDGRCWDTGGALCFACASWFVVCAAST